MSSLSAKVKDLFSSGDSKESAEATPQGTQSTQHPPGSFPTEDMEPSATQEGYSKGYENEQNKLHKPNDPRGWTEGDSTTAPGHGYKDSGVGLTGSNDPTSYKPSQDPTAERRNDPLERRDDPLQRRDNPLERTTESTGAGRLGDNTNLASREGTDPTAAGRLGETTNLASRAGAGDSTTTGRLGDTTNLASREGTGSTAVGGLGNTTNLASREGTGSTAAGGLGDNTNLASREGTTGSLEPSSQEHPYWGDLPPGGGGVHNTVVGHGSPEDEAQRHRAVHSGATQPAHTSAPLESGTFPTTQRKDREPSSTTTNPYDAQRAGQENPNERTSGSHFNEGLTGAGAAGAGALGAHELSKRHHADETPRQADQTTTTTHPDEHKGRSFPLIGGKDHKDKDTHHHKDVKEEKHKEPKPEHESKLGALFHRSSKDETDPKTEQEAVKDKHHGSKAAPALAAAGAGGATYAATRDRHGDDTQRDPTASRYQDPSATRGTDQYSGAGLGSTQGHPTQGSHPITGAAQQPYQQDDSHRGAGLASGAAAGLGAGALASHHGQRSHDDRTGVDPNRGYDAQRSLPAEHSTTNPAAQSHQQDDSHRGAGLATGAAAGLGAGALASHHGQRSHDDRTGLDSNPAAQSYQQQAPQGTHGLSEAAVSGFGSGSLPPQSGLQHTSGQPSALGSDQAYDAQRSQPPANFSHKDPIGQTHPQEDSHRGAGLAAGTAAGLGAGALASRSGRDHQTEPGQHHSGLDSNRGFESQSNQPLDRSLGQTTAQPHHQQDSHHGAGLASGTAAGLGAGALASRSGRDHQSETGHSGLDPLNRDESHSSYSTERSARDPTHSHQQEGSHRGAGLASGTAAGLGAGALASHEINKRHGDDQHPTEQGSRGLQSGTAGTGKYDTLASGTPSGYGGLGNEHTTQNPTAGKYDHLASGTASGIAPSATQPLTGSHNQSQRSTEGTHHQHHTIEELANAGKYNTLASGTPSGVAYDDDNLDNTRSSQRTDTNIPQSKDHHYGSTAAGLGAAAAGAGGASALSRDRDDKPIERQQEPLRQNEPHTERSLDRQTESKQPLAGGVASALSSNKPVIHKCNKCGEDNDITQYFKSDSSRKI
ncbi:hypothetical protein FSARC_9840 [Fusarium sarcochroum]|uniref:Uncharacterized protein n=1 Tax=Fusarium sarcochroum TaxID=1208366 RepID=A0A8H4TQ23_9HYPO|nr:hypothetical protein FSARC_9840 [Fusarium sarcochroum]